MTCAEFIRRLLDIQKNYKTVYGWGTFGWPWSAEAMARVAKQYPTFYTPARQRQFSAMFGKGFFAFDCVGLIKGILWGWDGSNKAYGGATYTANNVPDIDANMMKNKCGSSVSSDFSRIEPGEIVWMQGHIGVFIGDGKAVECTPSWGNGVQITAVANIGPIAGLNKRMWTNHGKLPWVQYEATEASPIIPNPTVVTVGGQVMITGERYAPGGVIPAWVKQTPHVVSRIDGANALLGADGGINSWVGVRDLSVRK